MATDDDANFPLFARSASPSTPTDFTLADEAPSKTEAAPADPPTLIDRLVGTVLGGAIGDAMGHPTEFMSMESIHHKYGPRGVERFELFWETPSGRVAPDTDDRCVTEYESFAVGKHYVRRESAQGVLSRIWRQRR